MSTSPKTFSSFTTFSQGNRESSHPAQLPMYMILDLFVRLSMAPEWASNFLMASSNLFTSWMSVPVMVSSSQKASCIWR